jgi:hypothetical protein
VGDTLDDVDLFLGDSGDDDGDDGDDPQPRSAPADYVRSMLDLTNGNPVSFGRSQQFSASLARELECLGRIYELLIGSGVPTSNPGVRLLARSYVAVYQAQRSSNWSLYNAIMEPASVDGLPSAELSRVTRSVRFRDILRRLPATSRRRAAGDEEGSPAPPRSTTNDHTSSARAGQRRQPAAAGAAGAPT